MSRRRTLTQATRHWLAPGMRIKRWLLLLVVGASVMGVGVFYLMLVAYQYKLLPSELYNLLMLSFLPLPLRIVVPFLVGGLITFTAVAHLGKTLLEPFRRPGDSLAASLYQYSRRNRGPHVVAIGGGTGLPRLLRGLKSFTSNITAVVTVADDGGSSGRLREELGMLPPGDFRNNIAALSQDEDLMTQVLQYRFGGDVQVNGQASLRGHAFGNLLLAALTGVTGSFDEGLLAAERVLALQGRVVPSTLEQVMLGAEVVVPGEEGQVRRVVGESAIPKVGGRIQRLFLEPDTAPAYPPAVRAILQADLIVLGSGSLYTSILPNLLVPGIAAALQQSRALCVYICNIAVQPGETDGFTVADHVDVLARYIGPNCIDVVLANNNYAYFRENDTTVPVEMAWPPTVARHVRLVKADLVDEQHTWRHDSEKVSHVIKRLLEGNVASTQVASRVPATHLNNK